MTRSISFNPSVLPGKAAVYPERRRPDPPYEPKQNTFSQSPKGCSDTGWFPLMRLILPRLGASFSSLMNSEFAMAGKDAKPVVFPDLET